MSNTIEAGTTGTISGTCCANPGPAGQNAWTFFFNNSIIAEVSDLPPISNPNGWTSPKNFNFTTDPSCHPSSPGGGYNPLSGSVSITVPSNATPSTPGSNAYGVTYSSHTLDFGLSFDVTAPTGTPPPPGPMPGPC